MTNFFHASIREEANERFKRRCPFSLIRSWSAWDLSYEWRDHSGRLRAGDTVAFIERLGWSPYPALVVATIASVSDETCDLAVVIHEAARGPQVGDIIRRPVGELLHRPLKRWPRQPVLPPGSGGSIRLPYFTSGGRRGGWS